MTPEVPSNPRGEPLPGLPLAQNLLRQLETPVAARLDPDAFYGWPLVPLSLTIEQIGKTLGPVQEYSHPDQHTEKVRYFNVANRQIPIQRGQPLLGAGVHTIELVRQAIPGRAVCCLEQIATWLRLSYLDENFLVQFLELYDGTIAPPFTAQGSPFPFTIIHPVGGGTLSVKYTLIRECVPDAGFGVQPAFVGPTVATPIIIPTDIPILTPWEDQRYNWNGSASSDLYWVIGDRSILRLFATITITGAQQWIVEIAGRLSGYNTVTGYLKKALEAATERH